MQLLRTIAILFIFFYGFRLLFRYVFPFLLKRWFDKKMQGQGTFSYEQDSQKDKEHAKREEGKIKIKSRGNRSKTETEGLGDVVDYEEVD